MDFIKFNREAYPSPVEQVTVARSGRIRIAKNGQEVTVTETPVEGAEPETRTEWRYDVAWVTPERGEKPLECLKRLLMEAAERYGSSPAVDGFEMGGKRMWLDKLTRNGLKNRLEAEKEAGKQTTTLWYGQHPVILGVDDAQGMLTQLELYASQCFDTTQQHLLNISLIGSADEMLEYDYTAGYPEQLVF